MRFYGQLTLDERRCLLQMIMETVKDGGTAPDIVQLLKDLDIGVLYDDIGAALREAGLPIEESIKTLSPDGPVFRPFQSYYLGDR
jgi:hypothetical protein